MIVSLHKLHLVWTTLNWLSSIIVKIKEHTSVSTVSLEKPREDGSGKRRVSERLTAWQAGSLLVAEKKFAVESGVQAGVQQLR